MRVVMKNGVKKKNLTEVRTGARSGTSPHGRQEEGREEVTLYRGFNNRPSKLAIRRLAAQSHMGRCTMGCVVLQGSLQPPRFLRSIVVDYDSLHRALTH